MSEKLLFVNANHIEFNGKITEGGFSRNIAWETWIKDNINDFEELHLGNNKICNTVRILSTLLLKKNFIIFFLYPSIGTPVFYRNYLTKVLSSLFFYVVRLSSGKNKIIFDISDLKYEQAVDLELMDTAAGKCGKEIEGKLFHLKARFIFASYNMRNYACEHYGIQKIRTDVCINGGAKLIDTSRIKIDLDINKINYVYSGTLNKGRQIEQLIDSFPKSDKMHLYLLGKDGEWIAQTQENITYLGELEENDAHFFVSNCDVGLIPYDENRLYYNIAYPTKLSFYLTANIAYISTPVSEVLRVDRTVNGGWIDEITEWQKLFLTITKKEIIEKKQKVKIISSEYLWKTIFDKNIFIH